MARRFQVFRFRPLLLATEHHATRLLELEEPESRALIDELVSRLDRRMTVALSVTDGHLFVSHVAGSIDGAVTTLSAVAE